MNATTATSPAARKLPIWRDRAEYMKSADFLAVLIALALPWSTSAVGILGVLWLVAVTPTLEFGNLLQSLKRPISALPIALFVLALVGMLWSEGEWGDRFRALTPAVRLLILPLLLHHFERSTRGMWVFVAFLASCVVLMVISWLVLLYPGLSLKPAAGAERGIFVKNYIDQSQEFTLCAVALAYPVMNLLRARRFALAVLLVGLALSFFVNLAFVVVSRTALVTVPVMFAVFALLHLRWRSIAVMLCVAAAFAAVAWQASPQLRQTADTFVSQYRLYKEQNAATSIGLRLEFWKKSLGFFTEAPVFGHGTGATRHLFELAATGNSNEATREVIGNPHNQTLNVAVQWGIVGVVALYAMWLSHLLLFRGDDLVNWIGLLVVVQNIFTSLFNSHIFDFHEGWMYVLGVGVAGGMVLKAKADGCAVPQPGAAAP